MTAAFPDIGMLAYVARPVVVAAGQGNLLAAPNPAACRLFGVAYEEGLSRPLSDFVGATAGEAIAAFAAGLPRNGVGARLSTGCATPRGPALLAIDVARAPGRADAYVLTVEDSSAEASAAEALSQARAVLQALPVGIELYDSSFNAIFYNRKSDELFDYSDQAVANHDQWWELAFPEPGPREAARLEWQALMAGARSDRSRPVMAEWDVMCADGERRTIQFYYQGAGEGFSCVMWDVTERRRLEGELRALAETDSLTGLANRRSFFEIAGARLSQASPRAAMSVLMLDIDHFKRVNDRHGHAAGDEVLAEFARRAKGALRRNDVMARLGGEEFAAFLPGARAAEAEAAANRIRSAIAGEPITAVGQRLAVTVSIGVAARKAGETSAEAIVARADRALYAAKTQGRDRIVSADAEPAER